MSQSAKSGTSSSANLVEEVCRLLLQVTGIRLGPKQYHMVESKLARRMFELGINSNDEYLAHLRDSFREEMPALVSLLTTHHTFFFREFFHFEYLERHGLPRIVEAVRKQGRQVVRVWSAACSRGQEAYSLSMCLSAWFSLHAPDMKFEILASDIDSESVNFARNGVYRWDEIKEIPLSYLGSHWMRGAAEIRDFVKAKPAIKAPCRFEVANLLDLSQSSLLKGQSFDVIFCRNVYIYFSPEQIQAVTRGLLDRLAPHGLLFLGISETLTGFTLPIDHLGHSVYAHKGVVSERPALARPATPAPAIPARVAPAAPLRVLCVDDSPVVLTLLKKFLCPEFGFEVVATAQNGLEAAQRLREVKADVMTLDIHMPGQNGMDYLRAQGGPNHPPVVMVSSVSRENADLALKCLELGATDYVEKPNFHELTQRGDEIRTKLRCAARPERQPSPLDLVRSFSRAQHLRRPEEELKLFFAAPGDLKNVQAVLATAEGPQPPTIVLFSTGENLVPSLVMKLGPQAFALEPAKLATLAPGQVAVGTTAALGEVRTRMLKRRMAIQVFGAATRDLVQKLRGWPDSELVLEDLKLNVELLQELYDTPEIQVVPCTSFPYLSNLFLAKGEEAK